MRPPGIRTFVVVLTAAAAAAAPFALAAPTTPAADHARATLARAASVLTATDQAPPFSVDRRCFAPAGHPDPEVNAAGQPTNPTWIERDNLNQYCALLRTRDQLDSPAFGYGNLSVGAKMWIKQAEQQLADGPSHVHGGITTLIPGSQGADPF